MQRTPGPSGPTQSNHGQSDSGQSDSGQSSPGQSEFGPAKAGEGKAGTAAGETVRLVDRDGHGARLTLPSPGEPAIAVLDTGKAVRVPPALMVRQDSGAYSVAARFDDLPQEDPASAPRPEDLSHPGNHPGDQPEPAESGMVIPVAAEEVRVRKEQVVTGKVRLRKIVHHEEQTLDEPLLRERVNVERVAADRWVDAVPPIRHEGGTLIVPVVEEVLVVEKRLRLREEVRLTWEHEEEHAPQTLVVRREEVQIERTDGEAGAEDRAQADEDLARAEDGPGDDPSRAGEDRSGP
jgi:uncharacterized protein (TIGR02271 family)